MVENLWLRAGFTAVPVLGQLLDIFTHKKLRVENLLFSPHNDRGYGAYEKDKERLIAYTATAALGNLISAVMLVAVEIFFSASSIWVEALFFAGCMFAGARSGINLGMLFRLCDDPHPIYFH